MGNWSLTPLRSSGKQHRTRASHSSHLRKEVLVFSYTNPLMGCWGWKKGHNFPALPVCEPAVGLGSRLPHPEKELWKREAGADARSYAQCD